LRRLPQVMKFRLGRSELTKVFFQLEDGALTETVFTQAVGGCSPGQDGVPEVKNTVCVSSQIGCRRTCGHCSSGKSQWRRDLNTNEIVGQVAAFAVDHEIGHIVFQGMGEPLDNPSVCQAAQFLTSCFDKLTCSCDGVECAASQSRSAPSVCLSTVGSSRAMLDLAHHAPYASLMLSVMPDVERTEPLEDLLRCSDDVARETGQRVALSYTMIRGLDTEQRIDALLECMRDRTDTHVVQLVQYHDSAEPSPSSQSCCDVVRPSEPADIRRCISRLRENGCHVGFGQYCEFPSALIT